MAHQVGHERMNHVRVLALDLLSALLLGVVASRRLREPAGAV